VTRRAEQILAQLEKGEQGGSIARLADDLPLFSAAVRREPAAATAAAEPEPSKVEQALRAVDPDGLTPRAALEELYRLKALLAG
jgi:DNA mismatch repair protein MutS